MEGLLVLLGILLVLGLIVVPIVTFVNSSRITSLNEKIKQLEKRTQQQGLTLKALYESMERGEHFHQPQTHDETHDIQDSNAVYETQVQEEPAKPLVIPELEEFSEYHAPGMAQAAETSAPHVAAATTNYEEDATQLLDTPDTFSEKDALTDLPQDHAALSSLQTQKNETGQLDTQARAQPSSHDEELKQAVSQEKKQSARPTRSTRPVPKEPRIQLPSVAGLINKGIAYVKQWFKTGNMPVKVGILVLFAGVASLLNYATNQGWVNFTMQAKLATIAGLSVAAFIFAWRKRHAHRTFSLNLQGGSIGVLLLTIFAAFKIYHFIPAELAFGITILLIAFAGVLAVMQNSMAMAIFAVFAGFMAPIWLSTGSDNHVALFSYYAILNAGILGMSWYRPWRYLNLLGFAFTFGIGSLWGFRSYIPEKFVTTEPFLLLFFAFYLFIPIFYARKYKGDLRNKVDAALVFGTPLVAFSLQAVLLEDNRYALAGYAFGLGLIYFALRYFLATKERFKDFAPAYLALGMGFTTLAVPLAFSAQQTSCIYALEGAALVWWGGRQSRLLSRLSGVALQALASFAFVFTLGSLTHEVGDWPIANATFINMLILSGAALFSAWCYRKQGTPWFDSILQKQGWSAFSIPNLFYLWGLFWWCIAGVREIHEFAALINRADFAIIFAALTAWLAAEAHKKWSARLLSITTMIGLCLPVLFVFWQNNLHGTPLIGLGWLAWGAYILLGVRSIILWRTANQEKPVLPEPIATQLIWWPTLTVVATLALNWLTGQSGWGKDLSFAVTALPMMGMIALSLWRWAVIRQPLGGMFNTMRNYWQLLYFSTGLIIWCAAMLLPADNTLLPWIPFLNPIELLQLGFVFMLWVWLKRQNTQPWVSEGMQGVGFAAMGFLMLSVTTLRAVHHWGGVAWDGSILMNDLVLRYLSIVWCFVTVAASRHAARKSIVGLQEFCLALQVAAGFAFIKSWGLVTAMDWPVLNLDCLGMLALSLAGLLSAWWYLYYEKTEQASDKGKALAFYLWGLVWWCAAIIYEVDRYAYDYRYGILIGMAGMTAWAASKVYSMKPAYQRQTLSITVAAFIGVGILLNLWQANMGEHLWSLHGIVGWAMFAALMWLSTSNIRENSKNIAKMAQLGWWVWLALSVSIELGWACIELLHLDYDSAWYQGGIVLPWLLLFFATLWRWNWVRMPLGASLDNWQAPLIKVMLVVGGIIWAGALFLPSNTAPWPWIPVLNPIDLLQLLFAGMVFYELLHTDRQYDRWLTKHHQMLLLSIVGFVIMTVMTLRGVHHWGGVYWDKHIIMDSLTQTSLSILWSILGVAAWIWGSRKGQRLVWWGGAILMGIVLAKLLLLDRQELGNLLGIVSFIGYGLLCVVVGYFAPAPPKEVLNEEIEEPGTGE